MYPRHFLYSALLLVCCATAASADIKIKSRSSFGGQQGHESTTYIKGKRQRAEMPGGMASVTQCDLRRTVQLNGTNKTYMVMPFDDAVAAGAPAVEAASGPGAPARRGGVVTTTMKVTDTGERKQMFGYTARRIKTSMVTESSPDACTPMKSRMESDGWYIDLNVGFDCYGKGTSYRVSSRDGGCQDTYRTKQVGAARTGYPVLVTTTMYDDAGNASGSFTQEVTEISKAVLDAALFEVPADYRQVKDATEMYSAAAPSRADDSDDAEVNDDVNSSDADDASSEPAAPANARGATAAAAAPKKPGVVRVGVPVPNAMAGDGIDTRRLADAVRNTMISFLSGPSVEVVPLQARLASQLDAEARQKGCDLVVQLTVTHKKGGGGGLGGFLKRAAPIAASAVPYGGGAAGAVAYSAASAAAYTAADFSGSVKSRDELTIQYAVERAGGQPGAAATLKAKARSDGEDLISYLVGQVAAAVLDEATGQ